MADKQAKEAANNKDIDECYLNIPKSVVKSEIQEQSVKGWQREWMETTKGAIKKHFSQYRRQTKNESEHNTQLHDNSDWSWQHKCLFIQVENNR